MGSEGSATSREEGDGRAHLEHLARNVIAYLALFVALTGGAYAAAKVSSAQVADNSLRGVDIKNRSVTGADIARRTLRANHFRPGVLRAGPQGPRGRRATRGRRARAGRASETAASCPM